MTNAVDGDYCAPQQGVFHIRQRRCQRPVDVFDGRAVHPYEDEGRFPPAGPDDDLRDAYVHCQDCTKFLDTSCYYVGVWRGWRHKSLG